MKVVNIAYAMIKLQFKLPQTLISQGFTRIACPCFSAKRDQSIDGEVLTRRVSALLDDLSLFASRIVILRDVSPPFSGKILMVLVHIVAKRKINK